MKRGTEFELSSPFHVEIQRNIYLKQIPNNELNQ